MLCITDKCVCVNSNFYIFFFFFWKIIVCSYKIKIEVMCCYLLFNEMYAFYSMKNDIGLLITNFTCGYFYETN